jgi:hypothetical protein
MRLRDMQYIGFKHQRENKQNSDNKSITTLELDQYEVIVFKKMSVSQQKLFNYEYKITIK